MIGETVVRGVLNSPIPTPNTVTSPLCGTRVRFRVGCFEDIARARTLLDERPVIEWLMRGVGDETTFWDVGAFHGHYGLVAAARGADILAFEPDPQNAGRLRENVRLNGLGERIACREVALSDTRGSVSFGYVGNARGAERGVCDGGETRVPAVCGREVSPVPDVCKVDVEGHECAVLDGMVETLEAVRRIAVEVHGDDEDAVIDRLDRAGMSVTAIDTGRSQTYIGGHR